MTHLKQGKSIALGFYIAILFMTLVAVAITGLSVFSNDRLQSNTLKIIDVDFAKGSLNQNIQATLIRMSRAEKSLIMARTNKIKAKFTAQLEEFDLKILSDIEILKTTASDVQLEKINLFLDVFDKYKAINERVVKAVLKKKQKKAIRLSDGRGSLLIMEAESILQEIVTDGENAMALAKEDIISFGANLIKIIIAVAILGILISSCFTIILIRRSVIKPLKSLTRAMDKISHGNFEEVIPGLEGKSEFGEMARTVSIFKNNMIENVQMAEDQKSVAQKGEERNRALLNIMDDFKKQISGSLSNLNSVAAEMTNTAEMTSSIANNAKNQSQVALKAVETSTSETSNIASAAEQVSMSVQEISNQASNSTTITKTAVSDIETAKASIEGLNESSQRIGEIVGLIEDIASQTNLLALNATIEAARAGDAGKGFAVVASEVKSLANQTSNATEEISNLVKQVQSSTAEAVASVDTIGTSVSELSIVSEGISHSISEQQEASHEMSANIQAIASGTEDISREILALSSSNQDTATNMDKMRDASLTVEHQRQSLQHDIDRFLENVENV